MVGKEPKHLQPLAVKSGDARLSLGTVPGSREESPILMRGHGQSNGCWVTVLWASTVSPNPPPATRRPCQGSEGIVGHRSRRHLRVGVSSLTSSTTGRFLYLAKWRATERDGELGGWWDWHSADLCWRDQSQCSTAGAMSKVCGLVQGTKPKMRAAGDGGAEGGTRWVCGDAMTRKCLAGFVSKVVLGFLVRRHQQQQNQQQGSSSSRQGRPRRW